MRSRALELAGGERARIAILPQASGREGRGESSVEMWREEGAREVRNLDGLPAREAAGAIRGADLIWMPGGDQNRLMRELRELGLVDAVREAYGRGATVGGTSAGAAVMSAVMITGRPERSALAAGNTPTAEGLGLLPDAVVDQHFVARDRNNRLLSAVLERPALLGLGVDERTAAIVLPGGRLEVVGDGAVVVYDARAAEVAEAGEGQAQGATGLALHLSLIHI